MEPRLQDRLAREDGHGEGLPPDDDHIDARQPPQDHQTASPRDPAPIPAVHGMKEDAKGRQQAQDHPAKPEGQGIAAAADQIERHQIVILGAIELGQEIDEDEEQNGRDEDTHEALESIDNIGTEGALVLGKGEHEHQHENRQPIKEGHDDEHGRQYGGVVGLTGDDETENRARASGQQETPDEGKGPGGIVVSPEAAIDHGHQIGDDDGDKSRIEDDVPGKDGAKVIAGHGHDQTIGSSQIQNQDHEAPNQQRHRQEGGETAQGLIGRFPEDGADTGDIEGTGGGNDEEDGKDMGQTPDHFIVHARDPVALVLHVPEGQATNTRDGRQTGE